jgi:hypothetical protein
MKASRLTRVICMVMALLAAFPPSLPAALASDFGFSFGHVTQYDAYHESGLSTYLGITKGLTERLEVNVFVQTELTPVFIGDKQFGVDLAYSLMGKRWDAEGFAGAGLNLLVAIGILAGMHSTDHVFGLDSIVVKITPIAIGTSHAGKRDRFCTVGVDWNIRDNNVSFIWNLMISDIYLSGTWRDDPSFSVLD